MEEIWKDVVGYEGCYQVSNFGMVKSLERVSIGKKGQKFHVKEKILKQKKRDLYFEVALTKNGNKKWYLVHRLVAMAFIPNPNNYPHVMHIDGKNLKFDGVCNNAVDNLMWGTSKMNNSDKVHIQRISGVNNYQTQKGYLRYKKVLCDGMIFNNLDECSNYYKMSKYTMRSWLQGVRKMPQKFVEMNLMYE